MNFINSSVFFLVVILVGVPLAIGRPKSVLMITSFVVAAFPMGDLAQIRTGLGAYFNIFDLLTLLVLLGAMIEVFRQDDLPIPAAVWMTVSVIIIAAIQSIARLGVTYDTIRAARWALTFPGFYFAASVLIDDEKAARSVLVALFLGTAVASVNSLALSVSKSAVFNLSGNYAIIRTAKLMNANTYLLPAMTVWPLPAKIDRKILYFTCGVLFVINLILSQTRSAVVAIALTIPIMWFFLRKDRQLKHIVQLAIMLILVAASVYLILHMALPELDILDMLISRILELGDQGGTTLSRRLAFEYELGVWLSGSMILGKGLSYFQDLRRGVIAFNHLGYLTYLAQLGLLGFLVYGIFVPFSTIQKSIKAHNSTSSIVRSFAVLSLSSIVYLSIVFLMSGSLLSHAPIPGILAGGAWGLSRRIATQEKQVRNDTYNEQLSWNSRVRIQPNRSLITRENKCFYTSGNLNK